MNTMEAICSRKSVRSYTGEPVEEETFREVIKAANAAPVGMKQYDSVHLTVISDPDMLRKIEKKSGELMGRPDMKCFYGAPTYILVSVKPNPKMPTVAYANAATVTENMLLAAVENGVGACCVWGPVIALTGMPNLLRELDIPEGFVPGAGIVLGKTDETYTIREIDEQRISMNEIK